MNNAMRMAADAARNGADVLYVVSSPSDLRNAGSIINEMDGRIRRHESLFEIGTGTLHIVYLEQAPVVMQGRKCRVFFDPTLRIRTWRQQDAMTRIYTMDGR